ncbi:hypothetical protein PtA15_7A21 [Puccinia triticina]|uniref:Uncharacterized protein n=1 Tax=Puccinia triticina TaxID=208348 RepID=A0ABY7CNL2_9BASI|nr:uncharacterized protein PtA15_7A21 [Puccinia triticina]WAQ86295.1 hypothetical protein PtA15_7A21 [Puccinia triticina]WAR56173.1 hypothetical protein PtB15_7B18 [Puccinia triticina]
MGRTDLGSPEPAWVGRNRLPALCASARPALVPATGLAAAPPSAEHSGGPPPACRLTGRHQAAGNGPFRVHVRQESAHRGLFLSPHHQPLES